MDFKPTKLNIGPLVILRCTVSTISPNRPSTGNSMIIVQRDLLFCHYSRSGPSEPKLMLVCEVRVLQYEST